MHTTARAATSSSGATDTSPLLGAAASREGGASAKGNAAKKQSTGCSPHAPSSATTTYTRVLLLTLAVMAVCGATMAARGMIPVSGGAMGRVFSRDSGMNLGALRAKKMYPGMNPPEDIFNDVAKLGGECWGTCPPVEGLTWEHPTATDTAHMLVFGDSTVRGVNSRTSAERSQLSETHRACFYT